MAPSSLHERLKTLYPLACLLVDPDDAPDLLLRVYGQVAERPPAERPDDLEAWLSVLLRAASKDGASEDSETVPAPEADAPPVDPLRLEVAEELLDAALPVAFATCSPQERVLLAVDAIGESEERDPSHLPAALDTTISDARAALQNRLRAILSEPESNLIDEAVPDTVLREAVRNLIVSRFSPVPRSLRSQVRETIQTVRTAESSDEDSRFAEEESSSLLDRLPERPTSRSLFAVFLIGIMVLAGGIGVWYWTGPSPTPSSSLPGLAPFSAERASSVTPELTTRSRAEADSYIESTWDRQIRVPQIQGARLQGVGRVRATEDTEIPVLLYTDIGDSARIAAFAYSYALVDRLKATVTLNPEVREELAQRRRLVSDAQERGTGLLWRDRDDIFVAVAPSLPADSLRSRLQP